MVYPNYYEKFKCIEGRCRHSCCIGWEIDIDEDTLSLYSELDPAILEKIEDGHFVLRDGERCPFLKKDGLCELICRYGDGALCQICYDHPRFYNEFSSREEVGLGLCCEEAARIILTQEEPFCLIGDGDDEFSKKRRALFEGLQNKTINPETLAVALPEKSLAEWADIFLSLERLEEGWGEEIEKLKSERTREEDSALLIRLLCYFLYRHLTPENFAQDAAFCYLCYYIVKELFFRSDGSREALLELSRRFSSEIEYSDINKTALYSYL